MSDITPHRIAAKFDLQGSREPSLLIPVFHEWIRRGDVLEGLLIDVADYGHVPHGPGVMLIGHEWDRALDLGDGRPGVLSVAKRGLRGDLRARVSAVIADALHVADALAAEPSLDGLAIDLGQVEVTVLDRINAPNTPATLAAIGPAIGEALAPLNGGVAPALHHVGDERRPFRVVAALNADLTPAQARDAIRSVAV